MLLRIGRFELEVSWGHFYVRVPGLGAGYLDSMGQRCWDRWARVRAEG